MSKSYDLSTSTKWANLADGEHTVKIKAKGSGFGTSSFSNSVTVTKGVAMPVKGDLITIESKQYRVLKKNGSVAEVLAMYDASTQKFDTNSSISNTYDGKNVDTYCNNTFYSGLSAAIKIAIVDKTFTQDFWEFSTSPLTGLVYTGKYIDGRLYYLSLSNASYGASITRHCYCLSVQDVLDYLDCIVSMDSSNTTLTGINVLQMFWNATVAQEGKSIWFRSADSSSIRYVFLTSGTTGILNSYYANDSCSVRPAFQIDLSKIEWSPVGGEVTEYQVTVQGVNGGYISAGATSAFVKVNSDTVSDTNYDFMFERRSTASHTINASKIALIGGNTIPDSDYSLDGTNYTELTSTPVVIEITQDCTIYIKTYDVD